MSNVYDEDEKYKPNLNGELDKNGDRLWINSEGEWHREDGPAIEWKDGGKFWYINDKLHREDGPAEEYANGTKYWVINGERHREDGPAIEYANGDESFFINGKSIMKDEWIQYLKDGKSSLNQKTELKLILENS
jgi:hypothetical protein